MFNFLNKKNNCGNHGKSKYEYTRYIQKKSKNNRKSLKKHIII